MSDEELLALAAKAIGLTDPSGDDDIWMDPAAGHYVQWNPLEDDGDALRLAVVLRLPISYQHRFGSVQFAPVRKVLVPPHWTVTASRFSSENMEADPFAATRRAIVRAAAEIGRAKGD